MASFGDGAGPAGSVTVADNALGYSLTMAPLFIPRGDIPPGGATRGRDVVVIGISGGEYETRGFVTAYDALTGERLWRFFTVPAPGEFGGDTWPAGLAAPFADPHLRGGGAVSNTPAYDPASGRLFIAVGNPAPNLDGTHRAGNNLFTDAIVALDVRTGQRVWHYGEGTPLGGAFMALDAATGAELFRHRTRGGVNAAPITFRANGKQLVTVAAGGAIPYLSRTDNLLITFGLKDEP